MKRQDDEPTSRPEKRSKPSRKDEVRRIVEEYTDDLALQLPFGFEVRTPSDRLVSSAPE